VVAAAAVVASAVAVAVAVAAVVAAASVAVVAAAVAVAIVAAEVVVAATVAGAEASADRLAVAIAVGKAWASELVRALHRDKREVIGPWPGTLGEARMRVIHALRMKLGIEELGELAKVVTVEARRGWLGVAIRDPEE
jgi:hypothetical protein